MHIRRLALGLPLIALLACSKDTSTKVATTAEPEEKTSTEASKELFASILERETNLRQPCLDLPRLPHTVKNSAPDDAAFQALMKHGLLEVREATEFDWGRKKKVMAYQPTAAMQPLLRPSGFSTRICFGKLGAVQVANFTAPTANAEGLTVSIVSFSAGMVEAPDWTKEPALAAFSCNPRGCLQGRYADQAKLVLTADGWQDAVAFGRSAATAAAAANARP